VEFSPHILFSDFEHNKLTFLSHFIDFYSFLTALINKNCEPEDDLNRSKHIVL
jgi:hypothetical protein